MNMHKLVQDLLRCTKYTHAYLILQSPVYITPVQAYDHYAQLNVYILLFANAVLK